MPCSSRHGSPWHIPHRRPLPRTRRDTGGPVPGRRARPAQAVDRFDPEVSEAFETYAVPTIQGELRRHLRDNTWGVHVPRGVRELRSAVRDSPRTRPAHAHRSPSAGELARRAETVWPATSRCTRSSSGHERKAARIARLVRLWPRR
ncbi:sigma factor [Streptomyces sp. NRRL F-5630]|uniref:sigma factor n=1 Tax=Streptomyces sp. NRRL F-5630 TaxID=1463864 RepID=UPI003EC0B4B7